MKDRLLNISWPTARLGEALEALARKSNLSLYPASLPAVPSDIEESNASLSRWIEYVAQGLGLEAKANFCLYGEIEKMISASGPALLRIGSGETKRFLVLLGCQGRHISI